MSQSWRRDDQEERTYTKTKAKKIKSDNFINSNKENQKYLLMYRKNYRTKIIFLFECINIIFAECKYLS